MKFILIVALSFASVALGASTNSKSEVRAASGAARPINHMNFYLTPVQYQKDIVSYEGDLESNSVSSPLGIGISWNDHLFFLDHEQSDLKSGNETLSVRHRHQSLVLSYSYEFYRPRNWIGLNAGIGFGLTEESVDTQLQSLQDSSRTGRQNLFQAQTGFMTYWKIFYLGADLKIQTSRDIAPNPQFSWVAKTGLQFTIF